MPLIDMIRQETQEILSSSIARLTILTFFGAILLNFVFLGIYWQTVEYAIKYAPYSIPPQKFAQDIAIYLVISFAYCFVASVSFTPKRMVSPLHVQIATCAGIIIQLIIAYQQSNFARDSNAFVLNSIPVLLPYLMTFIMLGWMMERGLRKLIGFSGTDKDLVKETFKVNVKYQDVRRILKDNDFCKDHEFRVSENNDEKIILRTKPYEDIKIVVVSMPLDQDQTIISIVVHGVNYDSLINSRRARTRTRSLKRDIEDELREIEPNPKLDGYFDDNEAYDMAKDLALKKTKMILKGAPIRLFVTVAILVVIGIWLIQPLTEQKITQDAYLAVWLTIITTIILLVVPTLREKRNQKD